MSVGDEDVSTKTWPVDLRGVTETLVTTEGPDGRWNVAPLGVHAPEDDRKGGENHPTARTWGRTRTWRNFREQGEGYVHFTRDPELFVEAALGIVEQDGPILSGADAWVRVDVEKIESRQEGETRGEHSTRDGHEGETLWTDWRLLACESEIQSRRIHSFNRGYAAVVEATVAASRLDVDTYDTDTLRERIAYLEDVCQRCGGPPEQAAFERLRELIDDGGDQQ